MVSFGDKSYKAIFNKETPECTVEFVVLGITDGFVKQFLQISIIIIEL